MADASRLFIAVIGGLKLLDADPGAKAAAKQTAAIIGEALAKAGFGLVVYYSDEKSIEPFVVSGYVAANPEGKDLIRVRYANSQRGQVRFKEQDTKAGLFEVKPLPENDWEAPFYQSLAQEEGVNAVLLLGGSNAVLIAGQIVVARKLPTLVVDTYGGSAQTIWNQLSRTDNNLRSWADQSADALVEQLKKQCIDAIEKKERERTRVANNAAIVARLQSRDVKTAYLVPALIVMLAMLVLAFSVTFKPIVLFYTLSMLVGVFAAGATGALVSSLRDDTAEKPYITGLLGGIAGVAVGLAYLIPQWISLPKVIETDAVALASTDKIQIVYAVLYAIIAGLGFDAVFARLRKRADDIPLVQTKS